MINKKKIIVILPAYNAEKTLEKTFSEIPFDIVDDIILTDDFSKDHTVSIAKKLETTEHELMHTVFPHPTLSEGMHESVLDAYNQAIHY